MRRKKNGQDRLGVNEEREDESEAFITKRRMSILIHEDYEDESCEGKKMRRIEMDETSPRLQ